MNKYLIHDFAVKDQKVLVRVDFNVPLNRGVVVDDTRIQAALPTIKDLLKRGAAVILMSHLGRPKGTVKPEFTLAPVAAYLGDIIDAPVRFIAHIIGPEVDQAVSELKGGEVLMLENLRFDPRETQNDPEFAAELAKLADLYVNDAFGVSHRAHASVEALPRLMEGRNAAGYLLEKEIVYANKMLKNPARPFTAVLGGAKVSDKITVIESLLEKVDNLIIGGGMANTFLKAMGYGVGKSLVEADKVELAHRLMVKAQGMGVGLFLPVDVVTAAEFLATSTPHYYAADAVPAEEMILDIGPATCEIFVAVLKESKLVVWNGPMGVFEMPAFASGTRTMAAYLAVCPAEVVVGGGDSAAAVKQLGYSEKMDHISTGGGAFLELMEGKILPGLAALTEK